MRTESRFGHLDKSQLQCACWRRRHSAHRSTTSFHEALRSLRSRNEGLFPPDKEVQPPARCPNSIRASLAAKNPLPNCSCVSPRSLAWDYWCNHRDARLLAPLGWRATTALRGSQWSRSQLTVRRVWTLEVGANKTDERSLDISLKKPRKRKPAY